MGVLVMGLVIPVSILLASIVGMYEARQRRKGRRPGKLLSGTYTDEVTAFFHSAKRLQLDHLDSMSMMRDDEAQGAPPEHGVDLDRGIVRLQRPQK